jgi:hypothetical protein
MAWSPELNAALLQLAQRKVALYDAYISEMEEMPRDELYLQQHRRSFGTRPIRIITTGNHAVGTLGDRPTSLRHPSMSMRLHWRRLVGSICPPTPSKYSRATVPSMFSSTSPP